MKAVNDNNKLPKIIVVIPNADLLKFVVEQDSDNVKHAIKSAINWIMVNMLRAIDTKCEWLQRKKPGAVTSGEPKIVWIKMMGKGKNARDVLCLRQKYNDVLENILSTKDDHLIMNVTDAMRDDNLMSSNGYLNGSGKVCFWNEVDKQIEAYEKRRISLRPATDLVHPCSQQFG